MNKKEWSIVRYLRQHIDTKFKYNTCNMLKVVLKKDIMYILN